MLYLDTHVNTLKLSNDLNKKKVNKCTAQGMLYLDTHVNTLKLSNDLNKKKTK